MKMIYRQTFQYERSLYHLLDTFVNECRFEGLLDGESVLKECRNIEVEKCYFDLRYPLWHANKYRISNSTFTSKSRAPIWYCEDGVITDSHIYGVKAVRECNHIQIFNSEIISTEFGWKSKDIKINDSSVISEYLFLDSKDIEINHINFKGKYSFQYVDNVVIRDSNLDTKDAFWHSHHVTVINSVIKGEYLGWFSDGLTLINCKIIGTQPLCYCKNLKLINCEMINCDLSFEYSEVEASIIGHVDSIKNPKSGHITLDSVGSIIRSDSIMESDTVISINNKI